MPELPDLEAIRSHVKATSLKRKVNHIEVNDDGVLKVSPQTLRNRIKSHSFLKAERTGKYLFLAVESDTWLTFHFGMTGDLRFSEKDAASPKYSRVIFHFKNGSYLSYISRRKLGYINVIKDPAEFLKEQEIGPDALSVHWVEFLSLLGNKGGMIKTALMDQSMISGLGNVYVDELLYQGKIHPETKAKSLSEDQLRELFSAMKRILKTAINNDANPKKMPDHYLITHRNAGEECPDCGGKIERIKVGGRSTYICPDCQKLRNT